MTAQVIYAANSTGYRAIRILLNGTTVLAYGSITNPSGTYTVSVPISTIEQLNAGDYIEVQAYQNSGAALDTVAGRQNVYACVQKVS